MTRNPKPAPGPGYGDAAKRLEEILRKIEEGEVDIDELSGLVREAAELVTLCRKKIQAAEIQVKQITEELERESGGGEDGGGGTDESIRY